MNPHEAWIIGHRRKMSNTKEEQRTELSLSLHSPCTLLALSLHSPCTLLALSLLPSALPNSLMSTLRPAKGSRGGRSRGFRPALPEPKPFSSCDIFLCQSKTHDHPPILPSPSHPVIQPTRRLASSHQTSDYVSMVSEFPVMR
jgi:hypothetical protein